MLQCLDFTIYQVTQSLSASNRIGWGMTHQAEERLGVATSAYPELYHTENIAPKLLCGSWTLNIADVQCPSSPNVLSFGHMSIKTFVRVAPSPDPGLIPVPLYSHGSQITPKTSFQ